MGARLPLLNPNPTSNSTQPLGVSFRPISVVHRPSEGPLATGAAQPLEQLVVPLPAGVQTRRSISTRAHPM